MAISDLIFGNWKKNYKQASFRGIKFHVESVETEFGRKTAIHEFPDTDVSFIEDLGQSNKRYSFDAYIVGKRYQETRDRLIAACETSGPGFLQHPYFKELKEVELIETVRLRESKQFGGMAILSLVFAETRVPDIPGEVFNPIRELADSVTASLAAVGDFFEKVFDTFGEAKNVVNDVAATINDANIFLETVKSKGRKAFDFQREFNNIKNNAYSLMMNQQALFLAFQTMFTGDDTKQGVIENLGSKDFNSDTTSTEENALQFNQMIRAVAVIAASKSLTGFTFANKSEADDIRNQLSDAFDNLLDEIDDTLYETIYQLRSVAIQDIQTRSLNLPVLLDYKLPIALPSLFVAYDLYEDIERAQEIIDANSVVHPGFMPGGVNLEVLSRA